MLSEEIVDDNSARWGRSILHSVIGSLQIVGYNSDRQRNIININILSSSSIYTQKCQNISLTHLRTVNGELCDSYSEKISFWT